MRLAIAARDFATSLDEMIKGFKKTQMLDFDKIDSDLEGPWARVGQPGFKSKFEQRAEELEAGGMRPMSAEEYRQRAKDLADLEFDEKEAKIKQNQDIEIKALKEQQNQAEQYRNILADAFLSGQLEGTGLEGDAERMIKQLTEELATSEQAQMKGGELFFKGIPALEEAVKMQAKAKEIAKEQAQKALGQGYTQYITNPLVKGLKGVETAIYNTSDTTGLGGLAALPPGAVKGIAAGVIGESKHSKLARTDRPDWESYQTAKAPDNRQIERATRWSMSGMSNITQTFAPGGSEVPMVGRTAHNIMKDIQARTLRELRHGNRHLNGFDHGLNGCVGRLRCRPRTGHQQERQE